MRNLIFFLFLSVASAGQAWAADSFSAPVEVRQGFIVLHATVNGRQGNYILDSGAPGLVLNSQYHTGKSSEKRQKLQAVNGNVRTSSIENWVFQWNGFGTKGDHAYVIDLNYLEAALQSPVDGLVGLDVFDGYFIMIDYASQTLQLLNKIPESIASIPSVNLPLDFQAHLPMVTLNLGERAYHFALDSGSGSHLLDKDIYSAWQGNVRTLDPIELVGADQKVVRTTRVEATGLNASGIGLPPTQFVITDLTELKQMCAMQIDGVLGQPLFQDRIVLIDRDRHFIRLSAKLPYPGSTETPAVVASF